MLTNGRIIEIVEFLLICKHFGIFAQGPLITFESKKVINSFINNIQGNITLAPHSVNAHDGAFYIQHFQQFRDGNNFI